MTLPIGSVVRSTDENGKRILVEVMGVPNAEGQYPIRNLMPVIAKAVKESESRRRARGSEKQSGRAPMT